MSFGRVFHFGRKVFHFFVFKPLEFVNKSGLLKKSRKRLVGNAVLGQSSYELFNRTIDQSTASLQSGHESRPSIVHVALLSRQTFC